ncbi:nuclear transcription factor Y subunit A-9 [Lactuca sativa]|nr:nuclear transcription factor Y subunit A-9 [Lactuca sativa]
MSTTAMRANSHDSSSQEQSLDRDTQSDEVLSEEEDDVSKETHNNVSYFPSDTCAQEHQNFQHDILPRNEETLSQPPQLELVNQSVAPYYDPYYGGMMAAAYGQHFVHPQFVDVQQVRMPLPLEMAQEPVYVNAKQYHAILRRRQSRAKAELEKKLIKDRKPYLHESRHQHAMRRVRSSGGRFAKKTETDALKNTSDDVATGMKRVHSEPAVSFGTHTNQETRGGGMVNSCNGGALRYENQDGFQEGGSLGQQWSTIPSSQNSQRAVAMK